MLPGKRIGNVAAMGAAFIITAIALLLNGCELTGGDDNDGGDPRNAERPGITAYPRDYTVGLNGTAAALTVTAAVSDGGTLSYQWYRAESDTATGTAIEEADRASYTPPVTAVGVSYYYVVVTNTNNAATDAKTSALTSNRVKVEVIAGLIGYTATQQGGTENTADSTGIVFTFSETIDSLGVDDITVGNGSGSVTKGSSVTGTPNSKTWTLPITVSSPGTVTVSVTKEGVESVSKTITVYKEGATQPPITYTAQANGAANTTTSIAITFNETVTDLTASDITVSNGTGSVTVGALTGSGQEWSLALSDVTTVGDVSVAITKAGIESESKSVAVYKQDPPKTGNSITGFTIGGVDDLVEGEIDEENKTVVITLPSSQKDFTVAVTISEGATVALQETERNGISVYRVTAEDGITKNYTVYKTWLGGAGLELSGGPFINEGDLNVTVDPSQPWPQAVSRTIGVDKVNHFVLTATPGYDQYRWYVDGEQLFYYNSAAPSPDSNVVDGLVGGNYSVGNHILFLVAIKNGVPYTFEQAFTVIE